jgi:hypothetical protein
LKKRIVIKVIKRKTSSDVPASEPTKTRQKRGPTATATVNDWIEESRKSRLDEDSTSRETIDRWSSESAD